MILQLSGILLPPIQMQMESRIRSEIAKSMLKKCKKNNTDTNLALLKIRNTPTQGGGTSPAQRMLNYRTKSILPTTEKQLAHQGSKFLKAGQAKIKQAQQ